MAAFTIQRKTLNAGAVTPITPPYPCALVKIGNATADDVHVLSQSLDTSQYSVIAAGFEETFDGTARSLYRGGPGGEVAFYLLSIAGGPVVLKWL